MSKLLEKCVIKNINYKNKQAINPTDIYFEGGIKRATIQNDKCSNSLTWKGNGVGISCVQTNGRDRAL